MKNIYPHKNNIFISSTLEKIKRYDLAVKMGEIECRHENCPKCGEEVKKFNLHEYKQRIFFVIIEVFVITIETLLIRWKCPLCKKTFMGYPSFAIPYKNYTKEDVLRLSKKYILEQETSYENCASHEKIVIQHEEEKNDQSEKNSSYKIFEKSTIYRWISSLGKLTKALKQVLELINKVSVDPKIFRGFKPIFCKKYLSEKRKIILEIVQKLLAADDEFRKKFTLSIFPQFATRYWRI